MNIKINFGLVEVLSKGINWIVLPFLALILPPEKYGELVLLVTISTVYSSLILFGQNRTILKYFNEDSNWSLVNAILIIFSMSMFVFLISFFYLNNLSKIILLTISATLLSVHMSFVLTYRATDKLEPFMALRFSHVLLRLFLCISLVIIFKEPLSFIIGEMLAVIISIYLFKSSTFLTLKDDFSLNLKKVKKSALFGFPIFLQVMTSEAWSHFDKFIINIYLGSEELALYAIVTTIASAVTFVTAYFSMNYEKNIYRSNNLNEAVAIANRFTLRAICACSIISVILLGVYYCFTLINSEIQFYADLYILISINYLLFVLYFRSSYLLAFKNKTKYIFLSSLLAMLINIPSNFWAIPQFGVYGAAFAKLLSSLALVLLSNYFVFKQRDKVMEID